MKKVLIITYYWPPSGGSGVQRWLKFVKFLPSLGWEPHVYTPENPHFHIKDESLAEEVHPACKVIRKKIWEPYSIAGTLTGKKSVNQGLESGKKSGSFISGLINWVRGNLIIPDPRVFWVRPSISFLKNYIIQEKIDVVITTGPPHSLHLIGLGLKKRLGVKWIVDMRDPWSRLDLLENFNLNERTLKKHKDLESSVSEHCDFVISTAPSMPHWMEKFDHNKFRCITNGYDEEDFEDFRDLSKGERWTVYHAGLLNNVRNPKNFWRALDQLIQNGTDSNLSQISLHLVGMISTEVISFIKEECPHLWKNTTNEEYKKHNDVILDYMKADCLLLLVNNTDNARVNVPGKLFEYIATGKPIITIAPKDSDAVQIAKGFQGRCFDYDCSPDEIKMEFIQLYNDEGTVGTSDRSTYSRSNLTMQLVEIMDKVTSPASARIHKNQSHS